MKKNMPMLERFLAVVLILSMVLSFVPAGVFAQDSTQDDVTKLAAKLVREKVEVKEEPEEPTEEPTEPTEEVTEPTEEPVDPSEPTEEPTEPTEEPVDPSEPTEEPTEPTEEPVDPSEPTEEPTEPTEAPATPFVVIKEETTPEYVYNYTLSILVDDEAQVLTEENVAWFYENGDPVEQETEKVGVLEKMQEDTIYAVATYDGISIPVKVTEDDENTVVVAAADQMWGNTVAVGALFAVGHGLQDESIQGLIHERTVSDLLAQNDDGYYAKESGSFVIVDSWKSESGVLYAKKTYTAEAVKKIPAAVFTVGDSAETNEWFGAAQTVEVAVSNTLNLVSGEFLPSVTVGEETYSNWIKKNGEFVLSLELDQSATIYYAKDTEAEASLELKIDVVRPEAVILYAQVDGLTGKLNGRYRVTTGASGLAKVTINENAIDFSDVQAVDQGDGKLVYEGTFTGIDNQDVVAITAVNGAGISSDAASKNPMKVEFTGVSAENLVTDGYLIDGNQYVTFLVENCDASLRVTVEALDQDEKEITGVELTSEDGGMTYNGKVSLANGLSALKVIVTDPAAPEEEQRIEHTFDEHYIFDQTAPVVTVMRDKAPSNINGGVEYFDEAVTYTFTIQDELWDYNEFRVEYQIEGVEVVKVATYNKLLGAINVKVENNQRLVSMTMVGKDKTGNVVEQVLVGGENTFVWGEGTVCNCNVEVDTDAPEITAKISDNVKLFYINNGMAFAVLDQDQDCSTVTMTITVTDKNLDTESLSTAGWTPNADNSYTTTFTANIAENATGKLNYKFNVKDKAGLMCNSIIVEANGLEEDGYNTALALVRAVDENGIMSETYEGTILIDRRPPSSVSDGAPAIYLELAEDAAEPGVAANGKELFGSAVTYNMHVTDRSGSEENPGFDSGLKTVAWELNPEVEGLVSVNVPSAELAEDYDIVITPNEKVEAVVRLTIYVEDHVGNHYSYVKEVVVDNLAPRIHPSYDNNTAFEVNGKKYYSSVRTATITITDMNPDPEKDLIQVFGNQKVERQADGSYTVKFEEGAEHKMWIDAVDAAGNAAVRCEEQFTIDMTTPAIEVKLATVDTLPMGKLKNSVGDTDYFDAPIAVRISISDYNLIYDQNNSGVSVARVTYTTELTGEQTIDLADWESTTSKSGMTIYTMDIPLLNGDVLTGISISARDNANNEAEKVVVSNAAISEQMLFNVAKPSEESASVFSCERKLIVDVEQPQVTVTKTVEKDSYVQTFNGIAYYNKPVIYQFKVEDKFLDLVENAGNIKIEAIYTDGTEILELMPVQEGEESAEQTKKLSDVDTYSYQFKVDNGRTLEDVNILVKDNLGWVAEKPAVVISNLTGNRESSTVMKTGADEVQEPATVLITDFEDKDDVWSYTGEPIIVDTEKPKVDVKLSDNVKSFYTNGNTIYVILENPVMAQGNNAAEEHVTVTFKTTDKNLTLDENIYAVKSGEMTPDWVGTIAVNADNSLTLFASSEDVEVNHIGGLIIDANVIDLAGNAAEAFEIRTGMNTLTVTPDEASGHFNRTVSLDRRTPSTSDTEAPVIEIVPSITPVKTADGKDLFNGSFDYSLKVNDGSGSDLNAGLKYVKWSVTDRNGVVKTSEMTVEFNERVLEMSHDIPVTINGSGESNDVEIYIEAVDNVGNTITYSSTIGADNLAPRVTIEYSNHSVKNEFYFNANQAITVTIEELNFTAAKSTVDTQVTVPGWSSLGGNKYRLTLDYRTDGDYTFAMASTDLAGNVASIDIPAVLQKFTVDKTAPVIQVAFDPSVAVDTDGAGVQYFDKDRTVTVTINEHNFRASDVRADLGAANALGGWSDRGDSHVASETFTEGNNYQVSVNYEDLAGNPAQPYSSPTFSVDLGAPTITMTSGNLEMGQLNIVPDDLLLGFTINDEENNLKNFSAEVIFLDRNYREYKVEGAEFYTVTGEGDRTTGYVNFANISRVKENDGIYTIRLYAEDYAGHVVDLSPALIVSLNRFGSSFMVEDTYTKDFLTPNESGVVYRDKVTNNLIIKEINPTQVWQDADHTARGSVITIAVNGKSITLEEGVHYDLAMALMGNSTSKWYEYTYSIYPDVFLEGGELVDGEYSIFFYSEDEAGNRNSNETNEDALLQMDVNGTYSGKVSFVLDHQLPVVTILGVEEDEKSFDTNRRVEINISDNTPTVIEIYINGELIERVEVSEGMDINSDWFYYDSDTGSYYLNISGKKIPQDLKVVVIDAAGNKIEQEVNRLMLTDDVFAQYINSVPAIMISIILLLAVIILIFVLVRKNKKTPEQNTVKA